MRSFSLLSLLLTGTVLAGCSLAPDFTMPDTQPPKAYKEQLPDTELAKGEWKPAQPLEEKDRGQWWKLFGDEQLNSLETEAGEANQSLKAAAARVKQSRALAEGNRPSYLPDLNLGGNALRQKPPGAALAAFGTGTAPDIKPYNMYAAQGVLSYEADLFGAVRDSYKANLFDSDAQEATYRSTMLALQADVAQHYFTIRALDSERKLLRETVGIYTEAARIMQRKAEVGSASDVDTTRTQSELAGAKAQLILVDSQRQQMENALAVLLGKMPSDYTFAENPLSGAPPAVPAGLPSELLQRRPDVSAAVAAMQAANKRIGVARTAFFPRLILTASGGYQSTQLGNLFDWSSRTWALGQAAGTALTMSVFDSGRNFSMLDASKAAYEESVANYRQNVLVAFQDVEDSLTAQRLLADQSQQQDIAAQASSRTTALTNRRYEQGDVDYFQVVDAQRISLVAQRTAVQVQGQRFAATVALIRALGGGWEVTQEAQPASADAASEHAQPDVKSDMQPTPTETPKKEPAKEENKPAQMLVTPEPAKEPAEKAPLLEIPADADQPKAEAMPTDQPKAEAAPGKPESHFYDFDFGMDVMPKEATKVETPADKKDNASGGIFGFGFDMDVTPASDAIASKSPHAAGTPLQTKPVEEPSEKEESKPVSLNSGSMDLGGIFDGVSVVPADQALKRTQAHEAMVGTSLPTAAFK